MKIGLHHYDEEKNAEVFKRRISFDNIEESLRNKQFRTSFNMVITKAMGEENLHNVDCDKVENIANKLKVSMPDMIKAGFEGSFIKGNYPLINHLYHRIHYVGEKEKEFDLTGYDL